MHTGSILAAAVGGRRQPQLVEDDDFPATISTLGPLQSLLNQGDVGTNLVNLCLVVRVIVTSGREAADVWTPLSLLAGSVRVRAGVC